MLLRAKHVLPISAPPIKNGAVLIQGRRIAEVGSAKTVSGSPVVDFGDAVILPGFVNAHTHLELTRLVGQVPPDANFVGWLARLLPHTHSPDGMSPEDSTREGMRLSLAAGVTTVGDISARVAVTRGVLSHGPLRVTSFGEVIAIGGMRNRLAERLQNAINGDFASQTLSIALSPHAPYTVEADGAAACVEAADRLKLRLCMHVAESREEEQFIRHGDGLMRDYFERLGIWDDSIRCPRMSPIALAYTWKIVGPHTVLAHCNYVSDDDINLILRGGAHVAYCPRTHAAFGHSPHRFRDMLAAGVNVCVGTDSLASNPSLSVLDELRWLRGAYPDFSGHTLLEMATVRGARALGLDSETGVLATDRAADVVVIPLDPGGPHDPIENMLHSSMSPIGVFVRGRRL